MDYNITYRKKDKGIQLIVSYKDTLGKWKQKSKQGFETKREAKKYADKLVSELKELSKFNSCELSNLTIGELKKYYLEHIYLHKSLNTYKNYKVCLNNFSLDNILVSNLTIAHVQKCINDLINTVSPSTLNGKITIFKSMMNFAKKQYNIPIIDMSNLDTPTIKKDTSRRALSENESDKILEFYSKSNNTDYFITTLLGLTCGCRVGEIMGLTWKDIDFKNNSININKQWQKKKDGKFGFTTVKSKNSNRTIPLPSTTKNILINLKNALPLNLDQRLIYSSSLNGLTVNLNKQLRKNFNTCIHELRHTYATKLISNGLDFKTAAYILGHDVEQTMRVYSHVTNEMYNKASDLISNIF
ncbi:site-specific integrase [Clostridium sardiniense]|uniref:Site-specific integrase n=1 Tax=Clostridium sardiniense TaxID=29369 RepID=A0ABS7KWL4_CLOSR|nr:site-specific integrase [Clostridium sardiniense]MBY0755067.1 site-specific integrase [Clostridium sardiniense]MDQ0459075.1 integrase [Clostridium sardiniense]